MDVFRFEVDQPFSEVEIMVDDPEHRLDIIRTCDDTGSSSIGASSGSGRHIAPSAFEGRLHRHQYLVGSHAGPQYVAIRVRPGAFEGQPIEYSLRASITKGPPVDQTRTIILTHKPQMQNDYDGEPPEWRRWEDALHALAEHPGVRGRVITDMLDDRQIGPKVVEAYQDWLSAPHDSVNTASVALANAVRGWLIDLKQSEMPFLSYVVIAGDDNIVPFMRVRIEPPEGASHGWQRESAYMADATLKGRSRTGSALLQEYTLGDDVYAMSSKVPWGQERLEVDLPQISVGRLVESPADMVHTIDTFLARDGVLNLTKTAAAGYDFMQDGPELGDEYMARFGGISSVHRERLFGNQNDLPRWRELLFGSPWDLLFFAAHSTHFFHETPGVGRITARDILASNQDFTGRLVYGLACHAGLNVPGDSSEHAEPVDFAEAWSRRGATYVGTTGWAYGFENALQYQEDLMAEFTRRLVSRGGMSIGEALTKAKRDYYWDIGDLNQFHAKTLAGTVLYGLPMYRVATTDAPPDFGEKDSIAWAGGDVLERLAPDLALRRQSLQVRPGAWAHAHSDDGDFFVLDGRRPRPEAGLPVQPRLRWPRYTEDVFVEGGVRSLEPRSAVWLGGSYVDHANFRPWVVSAGRMGRLKETTRAEAFEAPGWFPSLPMRLRTLPPEAAKWREGNEAQVVVTLGQYDSATAVERLYDSVDVAVYYGASTDLTPPTIDLVTTGAAGDQMEVAVVAHDASTIFAAYVTWTDGKGRWQSEQVTAETSGAWRATIPRDTIALVQVIDRAGNLAFADNGGAFYRLTTGR